MLIRSGRFACKLLSRSHCFKVRTCLSTLYNALENFDYDPLANGERRVLSLLSKFRMQHVFDVGANTGEWARLALELCDNATVHCFEIAPPTYETLAGTMASRPALRRSVDWLKSRAMSFSRLAPVQCGPTQS